MSATDGFLSDSSNVDYYTYYPLRSHRIKLLPLRERKSDLFHQFVFYSKKFAEEKGSQLQEISKQAIEQLYSHSWTRNSDELQRVIKDSLGEAKQLSLSELVISSELSPAIPQPEEFSDSQRRKLLHAFRLNHFEPEKLAKELNISSLQLKNLIKYLSIEVPEKNQREFI